MSLHPYFNNVAFREHSRRFDSVHKPTGECLGVGEYNQWVDGNKRTDARQSAASGHTALTIKATWTSTQVCRRIVHRLMNLARFAGRVVAATGCVYEDTLSAGHGRMSPFMWSAAWYRVQCCSHGGDRLNGRVVIAPVARRQR